MSKKITAIVNNPITKGMINKSLVARIKPINADIGTTVIGALFIK